MSTDPAAPAINRIDHVVLTVADVQRTLEFYTTVLGMQAISFGAGRQALRFGNQKLNLHQAGHEIDPKAKRPTPGSADLCLVSDTPLPLVMEHLARCAVPVEDGPVARTGALGPIMSVYFRDPDGNLIEVSTYEGSS